MKKKSKQGKGGNKKGNGKTIEPMKAVTRLCGGLLACRVVGERSYELTMMTERWKKRLMDGLEIGDMAVMAKELCDYEMVVSFLNLPAYIPDQDIEKLKTWGLSSLQHQTQNMAWDQCCRWYKTSKSEI